MSLESTKFEKSQLRADALANMRLIKPSEKLFYEKKLTEMSLSFLGSSQTIAGYYPINNELNILPLLQLLSSIGYQIALPCITEKKILYGICYPAQIIPKLPRVEHDQKLDFLVNLDEI